ncbi:MAG: hypothetical protein ACYSYL_14790 [Planctomycetota bacterium]|jgi:hypothetical protein
MSRLHNFVHNRLGWRAWRIFSMCYEKLRQFAGYPPATYDFTVMMKGEPALKFSVAYHRRTWRLVFVPESTPSELA